MCGGGSWSKSNFSNNYLRSNYCCKDSLQSTVYAYCIKLARINYGYDVAFIKAVVYSKYDTFKIIIVVIKLLMSYSFKIRDYQSLLVDGTRQFGSIYYHDLSSNSTCTYFTLNG